MHSMTSKTTRQTTTPASIPNEARPLNARQLGFCRNVVANGGNATKAYVDAGYSPVGANAGAARLLANVSTKAEIASIRADVEIEATVDRSYVIANLRENAARAMQAVPVLDRDGNETGVYKYQGSVANRSLELLGKSIGMFVDVHESPAGVGEVPQLKTYTLPELLLLRELMVKQAALDEPAHDVTVVESTEVE